MHEQKYIIDYGRFDDYIRTSERVHFVIDFSAVLKGCAPKILQHLITLSKNNCFYVIKYFDRRITQLIDHSDAGVCTDSIRQNLVPAWEQLRCLPLRQIEPSYSAETYLAYLSNDNHKSCLVTGNATETWRHILERKSGSVLLVGDSNSYFYAEELFDRIIESYGDFEKISNVKIDDNGSAGECKTASLERYAIFFKRKHRIKYIDVISSDGAEGIIYKTDDDSLAVKAFSGTISKQKLAKIEQFIGFARKKEWIAWPLEFVYSCHYDNGYPIGFTMPYFSDIMPLEELQYLDIVNNCHRWKIAISLLGQVLSLYLQNIQIGDYNFNNFGFTDDCQVVLMDMDSYVYGSYGTQVHGRHYLPITTNYSRKIDVIHADYLTLKCMVFWVLSDGCWPYYYDEDKQCVKSKYYEKTITAFQDSLKQLPEEVKKYYSDLFSTINYSDPFELLFLLFDTKECFFD